MCFEDRACEQVYMCGRTTIFSCSLLSLEHRNLHLLIRSVYVNVSAFECSAMAPEVSHPSGTAEVRFRSKTCP